MFKPVLSHKEPPGCSHRSLTAGLTVKLGQWWLWFQTLAVSLTRVDPPFSAAAFTIRATRTCVQLFTPSVLWICVTLADPDGTSELWTFWNSASFLRTQTHFYHLSQQPWHKNVQPDSIKKKKHPRTKLSFLSSSANMCSSKVFLTLCSTSDFLFEPL